MQGPAARSLAIAALSLRSSKNKNHPSVARYRSRFRRGHLREQGPDKATEFARERHGHFRFHDPAPEQMAAAFIKLGLHFPTEFAERGGLPALAHGQLRGDRKQIFLQHRLQCGQGQHQFPKITMVRFTPVGLALKAITLAQEKGLQPQFRARQILRGVSSGSRQVENRFVHRIGHMNAGQFPGAMQPREHERITAIRHSTK